MRQLLLLRHAKSSWDDPKLADHARPLNRRGHVAATAIRTAMEGLGLAPDLILVSTSQRTLQTMHALEPWPETPLIEPMDQLYLADVPTLLAALHGVAETVRSAMLVGHNPGLHELAITLAGPQAASFDSSDMRRLIESYPTGAVAEFTITGPWHTLSEGGGRLVRFICPRDLPGTTD